MRESKKSTEEHDESRWFKVTGERFDWMPRPGLMISFPKGAIGYRPKACIEHGLAMGVIEVIRRPAGYSVNKAGEVVKSGD